MPIALFLVGSATAFVRYNVIGSIPKPEQD